MGRGARRGIPDSAGKRVNFRKRGMEVAGIRRTSGPLFALSLGELNSCPL